MNTPAALLVLALLAPPAPDNTDCVKNGLKWLAEQQKEDGSWTGRAASVPTITTAMAGLALLMEGSTLKSGTYAPNLRKAVEWMEKQSHASGLIASEHRTEATRPTPAHAHAILFLACIYEVDDDPLRRKRLGAILRQAINYANEIQTTRGGWRNGINIEDQSATIDMLHALLTARKVGFAVPDTVTDRAVAFLTTAVMGNVTVQGEARVMNRGTTTLQIASGLADTLLACEEPRPAVLAGLVDYLESFTLQPWSARTNSGMLMAQFHLARVRFALGEHRHATLHPAPAESARVKWSKHRNATFAAIRAAQSPDGSWADTVPGPVYGSALALIILQMENEYVPAFSR